MLLRSITLKRLLSFRDCTLDLRPLNIIIGANASGKSNLASALSLLQAAPRDMEAPIRWGGGVNQWISKRFIAAEVPASISCEVAGPTARLDYKLSFREESTQFRIYAEELAGELDNEGEWYPAPHFARLERTLTVHDDKTANAAGAEIAPGQSALSLLKGPRDPEAARWLGQRFSGIQIYRSFDTGPRSPVRQGVGPTDVRDQLDPRGDNLALVLDDLKVRPGGLDAIRKIKEYLARFWEEFEDLDVRLSGGSVLLYAREKELEGIIPASRLSDGTLRFLCLMAILLHPEPGPLICLEEPEAGLHPDAVRILAEALEEASERTQVIVTTQSPELVNAFSHDPAAVVVCERGFERETTFRRLVPEELESWLEAYSLGEVWRKGEIGGNRW